ncbi:MAG: glycosyltransferase [Rubripirellula sp.]
MRICIFGRANYEQLKSRTEQLAVHDLDIHILSLQAGQMDHATVHQIPRLPLVGGLSYLSLPIAARNLIRRLQPSVIDVHSVSSYGAYCFAPVAGIPVVATVYGSDVTAHAARSRIGRMIATKCLNKADLVYASSPIAEADIRRVLNVDLQDRFTSHSWGIEMSHVNALSSEDRASERSKRGFPADAVIAVHNRQFCDFWRIDQVQSLAKKFCQQTDNGYFVFVCPPADALAAQKIELAQRSVADAGLSDRIRFEQSLPHDQMLRLFNAADIFTCFGDADLLSSSLLEAMALGMIPIVRDLPAYREVISDQKNGYVHAELDEPTVLRNFLHVANHCQTHLENMGKSNRKLIATMYDAIECSRWMAKRYEQLAEHGAEKT